MFSVPYKHCVFSFIMRSVLIDAPFLVTQLRNAIFSFRVEVFASHLLQVQVKSEVFAFMFKSTLKGSIVKKAFILDLKGMF